LVLNPFILAAVLGLAGWAGGFMPVTPSKENHLTKHDGEITTLQRDADRILAKLDEILRELRGRG